MLLPSGAKAARSFHQVVNPGTWPLPRRVRACCAVRREGDSDQDDDEVVSVWANNRSPGHQATTSSGAHNTALYRKKSETGLTASVLKKTNKQTNKKLPFPRWNLIQGVLFICAMYGIVCSLVSSRFSLSSPLSLPFFFFFLIWFLRRLFYASNSLRHALYFIQYVTLVPFSFRQYPSIQLAKDK